jgi:hypothetical protein
MLEFILGIGVLARRDFYLDFSKWDQRSCGRKFRTDKSNNQLAAR